MLGDDKRPIWMKCVYMRRTKGRCFQNKNYENSLSLLFTSHWYRLISIQCDNRERKKNTFQVVCILNWLPFKLTSIFFSLLSHHTFHCSNRQRTNTREKCLWNGIQLSRSRSGYMHLYYAMQPSKRIFHFNWPTQTRIPNQKNFYLLLWNLFSLFFFSSLYVSLRTR